MLKWRLALGVVFVASLVALVWQDAKSDMPGMWLLGLATVVALAGAGEVVSLLADGGYFPQAGVIFGGTLAVMASNAVAIIWTEAASERPFERLAWPMGAFALTVLGAFVAEIFRYREPGGVVVRVALAVFGVAYVSVLLSFAVALRFLGGPEAGLVGLIAWIVVVKFGDIGAYTVGRLFGRHKLAPRLSPGKTWEGVGGAMLFACLGAWLVFTLLPPRLDVSLPHHPFPWLPFGLVVGLAGLLGDLAESLIKRDMGAKDSSRWMAGFGGVLDLLDSLLFSAPVAYLCWLWMIE